MNKLLIALALALTSSIVISKPSSIPADDTVGSRYVQTVHAPNFKLIDGRLLNVNEILYIEYTIAYQAIYFMSALNEVNNIEVNVSLENLMEIILSNDCNKSKDSCVKKDNSYISLYETPVFISILDYKPNIFNMGIRININKIEYIEEDGSGSKIIMAPYTEIYTKLSPVDLQAIIYQASHSTKYPPCRINYGLC
ncbi:hypothetical protein BJAS_P3459 [Bathymodiolus japonicus methanotrophic gill symbiont]|uniref:hypothetical protein n=1 Tax=Bathymodiolus japonicus methanotrophic gill symbiont TaxID=113269 RepID=UPI001B3E03A3|nr:hypothetical protein [Bathymodiolus japonicus methanotrophic gill symbiont]GFO72922.1 hypothetical protein BJAS_P3459 [Bathymodiolus japonicus methanotrophic gill symbiont]